jgi:hypothetical protein
MCLFCSALFELAHRPHGVLVLPCPGLGTMRAAHCCQVMAFLALMFANILVYTLQRSSTCDLCDVVVHRPHSHSFICCVWVSCARVPSVGRLFGAAKLHTGLWHMFGIYKHFNGHAHVYCLSRDRHAIAQSHVVGGAHFALFHYHHSWILHCRYSVLCVFSTNAFLSRALIVLNVPCVYHRHGVAWANVDRLQKVAVFCPCHLRRYLFPTHRLLLRHL